LVHVAGVAAAFAVHVVLAVSAGSLLFLLPHRVMQAVVAVLFATGATLMLHRHDEDPSPSPPPPRISRTARTGSQSQHPAADGRSSTSARVTPKVECRSRQLSTAGASRALPRPPETARM